MKKLRHLISTKQVADRAFIAKLFRRADELKRADARGIVPQTLKGKILASLFYEPSTRTRFSFETGMLKLGGGTVTAENALLSSSAKKGEVLEDSIKVLSGYADGIVIRHSDEGAAETAASASSVPVISGGSGSGEHPTQALYDFYTIERELGAIDGVKIAFAGDLLYGRTVHSHLNLVPAYKHMQVFLVSPKKLVLPKKYKDELKRNNIRFQESRSIADIAHDIDVLYVTRIQKERFASHKEYLQLKGSYVVDRHILKRMKKKSIILHPLPRVDEINHEIDDDRRAAYFRQAKNGLYVRMAILEMLLK